MKAAPITILGNGNLGWNLHKRLLKVGFTNVQILSESANAEILKQIRKDSKFVLICKSDAHISSTLNRLENSELSSECIVAHTSGSTKLQESRFHDAVFYPLQTFTQGFEANWDKVRVFIESKQEKTVLALFNLANTLGAEPRNLHSEQRKFLHIAGVFSSNFPNHLIRLVFDYLEKHEIDPEVVKPLMNEAIRKAFLLGPENSQTGPAVREEDSIINEHLNELESDQELYKLYALFSEGIKQKKT